MDQPPRALSLTLVVALSLVIVGGATDLWLDGEPWLSVHAAVELLMIAASAGCLVFFWRAWRESAREAAEVRAQLVQSERTASERQAERDRWRASAEQALSGLGAAIDSQFDAWGLTNAEREVAMLLLKGLGHKQIAAQTNRSERTVRQHAVVVYNKAGLSSRAELAAFFLQDLSLPARDV